MSKTEKKTARNKSKAIIFRVSEAHHAALIEEAKPLRMTANALCYAKSISEPVKIIHEWVLPTDLARQMNAAGSLLNQLVRRFHMTGECEPQEVRNVMALMEEILGLVLEKIEE